MATWRQVALRVLNISCRPARLRWARCYTEGGWTGDKTKQQVLEEDRDATLKELEPLKLPGDLAGYTGNVMYPNEESAVWDVDDYEKKE